MNTNTNTNTVAPVTFSAEQIAFLQSCGLIPTTAPVAPVAPVARIEWTGYARKNENRLVWLVRQAIEQNDIKSLYSLVKSWIVLVDKKVPGDSVVVTVAEQVVIASLSRKDFHVKEKEGDNARFVVESTGIVKSALYTIHRNGNVLPREYRKNIECPEEKPVKVREKKEKSRKYSMTEQEYAQFMEWKKASERKVA